MLELSKLELVTAVLTGAAALTLIPHARNVAGRTFELCVWAAFVLSAFMCVATFGDPRVQEATAAIAWGGIGLLRIQVAFAAGITADWTAAHRFVIANWVAIAAGVDALALAFMRSAGAARRSSARVHLAEWFELPRLAAVPAVAAAVDRSASIDRRLAAAARAKLRLVKVGIETSPTLARAAVGVSHVLGPGHLRLLLVKLALEISWRRQEKGRVAVDQSSAALALAGKTSLSRRARTFGDSHRKHHGRRPRAAAARSVSPTWSRSQQKGPATPVKPEVAAGRGIAFRD